MKVSHLKSQRLHSLDALRAVMMLLGIVLHATEPYSLGKDPFWAKDPNGTHISMNYIFGIIHIFRMPIFFMVAGFFGSMLFYDRGPRLMIKNRVKRILFPFVVFLLLLHPILITVWTFTSETMRVGITSIMTTMTWLPEVTYHLWFLYYLLMITALSFGLATLLKRAPGFTKRVVRVFEWLMRRKVIFIMLFSIILFLMLVWMWDTWISTPLSFAPDVPVLLAYSMFYFIGWVLFKSKHFLDNMMRNDWLFTLLGVTVFTLRFVFRPYIDDVLYGALNAITVWFFVFGISGLFIRYASRYSARMRYVSDASYWVYLIHLPLTGLIPAFIFDWPIPVFAKFLIVVIVTTVICFTTYHFLVRSTFIGKFLNGRKYPRKP
ncbi:acyltransferase family protein [Roseivirga sp. E12]|uniref:acyltransferase family protein n=1 Tax=Roseivirga sp. E12 TaxID=2819237 RepID=UPI001ABCE841|nr:acyltransferase family protein [Roseivirga sp. E12]MBO3696986.1 acyltransferase family protein [Roseivirga sp. E12]